MSDRARVRGLNHVTLAVGDMARAVGFYRDVLGFRVVMLSPATAYLEAGTLWLCLSWDAAARSVPHSDYTHIALDVDPQDFDVLASRVLALASLWKDNRSEGQSLYVLDPDGHKLELHVGSLASRLDHYAAHPSPDRTLAKIRGGSLTE